MLNLVSTRALLPTWSGVLRRKKWVPLNIFLYLLLFLLSFVVDLHNHARTHAHSGKETSNTLYDAWFYFLMVVVVGGSRCGRKNTKKATTFSLSFLVIFIPSFLTHTWTSTHTLSVCRYSLPISSQLFYSPQW